jgi:hypothetical protein
MSLYQPKVNPADATLTSLLFGTIGWLAFPLQLFSHYVKDITYGTNLKIGTAIVVIILVGTYSNLLFDNYKYLEIHNRYEEVLKENRKRNLIISFSVLFGGLPVTGICALLFYFKIVP